MEPIDPLADLIAAFDRDLPLAKARTIPSTWYHDPRIADLERIVVFGQNWQVAGRIDQLRQPGSFVTIEVAGEPVAVVRGDDGTLRAFSNVCRHRAARVLDAESGCVSRLRCPYHGWTYDLNGKLRGTPEFEGVEDFRREENGLVEFSAEEWGLHAWVHMGANPPPLRDVLAPVIRDMRSFGLERQTFVERRVYDVPCNWKVYVENYLDGGYHVNSVHSGLAGVLDYSEYRTINDGFTSLQTSPMRPSEDDSTTSVRKGHDAEYWWIFPNFMLNLYDGLLDTNLVLPLGPDRCRVIFDLFFVDVSDPRFIAKSIAVTEQIQHEDMAICEQVQRGLSSRFYDTGRYGVRREAAVYHFHRLLAKALQGGLR